MIGSALPLVCEPRCDQLRLALVSTPRSGNSWLRHMLARALGLVEHGVHRPGDLAWNQLPPRSIVQIHWRPERDFCQLLAENNVRVVVLSRHPMDVLISILSFCQHDRSTLQWLDGADGNELSLQGASPTSEAFLSYAESPRAQSLLSISALWWQMPFVHRVRYEHLVFNTAGRLANLISRLGETAREPLAEVVATCSPESMQGISVDWLYDVWHAQPELWQRLVPKAEAARLYACHLSLLRTLDYTCQANPQLTSDEAQRAWERLENAALQRSLHGLKRFVNEAEDRFAQEIAVLRSTMSQWQGIEPDGLGPWSLAAARAAHRTAQRFPHAARAVKSILSASNRASRAVASAVHRPTAAG